MKPLAVKFAAYRALVIPPDASAVQIKESRRAFYAGAAALMQTVFAHLSPGEDVTESDEAFMMGIESELKRFAEDVKEGRL